TVNVPADTDDIDYTLTADIDENGDFVVTATLKNDDKVWPATLPSNSFGAWADVQGVMTFTGHVDIVPCDQADLVVPTVDAAVCVGGVQQDPQSKTVNVPANTDLVSYELTKAIAEDGSYEVTATKDANTV
ncbi:MAG: hypothetical protein KC435_14925, partial [Thermomicrobiales bacterium]|nr:hypothetical protein [Thermomicrobiales bacterium]